MKIFKIFQATTPGLEKATGGYLSFSGDIIDEKYWRRRLDEVKHVTLAQQTKLKQL